MGSLTRDVVADDVLQTDKNDWTDLEGRRSNFDVKLSWNTFTSSNKSTLETGFSDDQRANFVCYTIERPMTSTEWTKISIVCQIKKAQKEGFEFDIPRVNFQYFCTWSGVGK